MSPRTIRHLFGILAIFALPATVSAQERSIGGMDRDTTGSVLPGVIVRAVHEERPMMSCGAPVRRWFSNDQVSRECGLEEWA